ncbi:MAG: response regulator [Clostridiales Family XIII bacterium]|jgi:CheY-like chemotaxis protein|nr:response regulator [Clostridiales Family XIII bacterium]
MQTHRTNRISARLRAPDVPPELRERFERERLDTNITRMYFFAWYIITIQVVLQILNIFWPQLPGSGIEIPIMLYILLSLATIVVGVVYVVLFSQVKRGRIRSLAAQRFLYRSLIAIYVVIQMVFGTFNILTVQGVNSQIVLMLLVGLVPIMRALYSGAIILASLAYMLILMYCSQGITDAEGISSWRQFAYTDMRANLLILTGLGIFISGIVYRLYVNNFLKSVALENAKARFLSGINHELRTPMNAIAGLAGLARNASDPAKAAEALDALSEQTERFAARLNSLSDIIGDGGEIAYAGDAGEADGAGALGDAAASGGGGGDANDISVPNLAGRHILVVDDVEINRTVLAGMVEMTGAAVVEAADGTEAVALFEGSAEGHFSLILMDVMMPRMDGNEAARRIRAMARADAQSVPIIAVSGNALDEDAAASLAAGMNRHLAKPVDFTSVMQTLRMYVTPGGAPPGGTPGVASPISS